MNTIREGFENHIAKQQNLQDIPKAVLCVQVFAMNDNMEYVDKKLQTKWVEWEAASAHQIDRDAVIIGRKYILNGHAPTVIFKDICTVAILNQLKV